MGKRRGRPQPRRRADEHVIPPAMPPEALGQFVLKRSPHEERAVREFVELEARGEKVTHLEKVKTERILGRKLDAWDVRTDKDRYWVITNPTNLYSQALFPSLDYTISFHIGLMERVWARQAPPVPDEQRRRLAAVWRRWAQAAEAIDDADEAEEFQAVGMRCRECLLEFVRAVVKPEMLPHGEVAPESGNFIRWAELIAGAVAPGQSAEALRGYLKASAKTTWQLVSWLTHAANANRLDGQIALDATQNLLATFGAALVRYERGSVDRCPQCSSYRLSSDYRPDLDASRPYVTGCESCGWPEGPATEGRE